jgi:hypothetical protein
MGLFMESLSPLTSRIVFLHIQKTGGTSLHSVLAKHFKEAEICPERHRFLDRVPEADLLRYRFFSGHYFYNHIARIPEPKIVFTILRDPWARLLSWCYYAQSFRWDFIEQLEAKSKEEFKPDSKFHWGLDSPRKAKELRLYDYLRYPDFVVQNCVNNTMTRNLIGTDFIRPDGSLTIEGTEAAALAIERLRSMSAYGIIEKYATSRPVIEAALGFSLPEILPRENTFESLAGQTQWEEIERPPIDEATEEMIRKCTELDSVVYDWAVSNLAPGSRVPTRLENGRTPASKMQPPAAQSN